MHFAEAQLTGIDEVGLLNNHEGKFVSPIEILARGSSPRLNGLHHRPRHINLERFPPPDIPKLALTAAGAPFLYLYLAKVVTPATPVVRRTYYALPPAWAA